MKTDKSIYVIGQSQIKDVKYMIKYTREFMENILQLFQIRYSIENLITKRFIAIYHTLISIYRMNSISVLDF